MNNHEPVFLGAYFQFFEVIHVKSRMAGLCVISMLNFLRNDQTGFHGKRSHFNIPTSDG